jgi:hypothetical protein
LGGHVEARRGAGTKSPLPPYHGGGESGAGADLAKRLRGGRMYSVVYWAGMATLLLWTAYSAYSAIIGL